MKTFRISQAEAGQTLEKFLHKIYPDTAVSFWYIALRKKAIKLNGLHVKDFKQKVSCCDELCLYHYPEESVQNTMDTVPFYPDFDKYISVVFEDEQVLVLNKPAGIFSQKAKTCDISLNEYMLSYLKANGYVFSSGFKPGVLNRLDCNTSGLILVGKTLRSSQIISAMIKNRSILRFYFARVEGQTDWKNERLIHYWSKNEKSNQVALSDSFHSGMTEIETVASTVSNDSDSSLVRLQLISGKSHQLRAQMSHLSHPVLGDTKYLSKIKGSLKLACCEIVFPEMPDELTYLSNHVFRIQCPF